MVISHTQSGGLADMNGYAPCYVGVDQEDPSVFVCVITIIVLTPLAVSTG